MRFFKCRAQSLVEYVTLISIVTMVMMIMFPLVRRAVQSVVKSGADLVGDQPKTAAAEPKDGYESNSSTNVTVSTVNKAIQSAGSIQIKNTENINTKSETSTKLEAISAPVLY